MEDDDDDDDEVAGLVFVHLRLFDTIRCGAAGGNEVDSRCDKCYMNRLSGGDQSGAHGFCRLKRSTKLTNSNVKQPKHFYLMIFRET